MQTQIPDFQRGWVWDDVHIRSLLASVSLSYPIGAVMLLNTAGLRNTHLGLVITYTSFAVPFSAWLLRRLVVRACACPTGHAPGHALGHAYPPSFRDGSEHGSRCGRSQKSATRTAWWSSRPT